MLPAYDLRRFRLEYDPSKFSPLSVVRRTLGNQPLNYDASDVSSFHNSSLMSVEGDMMNIHLKGSPYNVPRPEDGGLIMVSRDTGQLIFYPPGTDVDATMNGVIRGSLGAVWSFLSGLEGEAQNAIKKFQGAWATDRMLAGAPDPLKLER